MCGRYALAAEKQELLVLFQLEDSAISYRPRYNIAPAQQIVACRRKPGGVGRELCYLKWGFVPAWDCSGSTGAGFINARAETITRKVSFKGAFRARRALIPAGGFYEWRREGKIKQPFFIGMKGGSLFSFAGIWEERVVDGKRTAGCAIITAAANKLVAAIHTRMPVIIDVDDYDRWLNPETEQEQLLRMLVPFPAERMFAYRVTRLVNNPAVDTAACLERESGRPLSPQTGQRPVGR